MTTFDLYILFWVCIAGLCMGSFFNVVILRSLSGENIAIPASKCPKCGNKLKPWHNIPVLSYIFLKGKCAFCHEKISIQYPIVELLTMVLFGLCYYVYGFELKTFFAIVLCSALIIMTGTDLKERIVDCHIAIGLGILGLLYNFFFTGNIVGSILGLIVGASVVEVIARLCKLFMGERAFGEGDTYVAGALGACFGLRGLLSVSVYTLIAAAFVIFPIYLYKQYKNYNKMTCIMTILFILSTLAFLTLSQDWFTFSALAITGVWLVVLVLKNLKNSTDNLTLVPLVPLLAAGAICYLLI